MAVVLAMIAAVLLAAAALIGPDNPSVLLRAVYLLALWVGPVLIAGSLVFAWRRRVERVLRRLLIDVAGPEIIRSMPPRTVFTAVLSRVFGTDVSHEDVITGLLGGAGRHPSGRDTAASRSTTAHIKLRSIGDFAFQSEATWTHEFSGVRDNHQYIVFATWDREIASLVVSERMFPLFELWVVEDEDQLEELIPRLRQDLRVGIVYSEVGGQRHVVPPVAHTGEEVALRYYDRYVRLPDSVDRKDLRIVQLDLHDLADDDHIVGGVESMTIIATSVTPSEVTYWTWSPPHPCYVHTITFDVTELSRPGEELAFLAVSSTIMRSSLPLNRWTRVPDTVEVAIESWMMPGHGVTLLWRPVDESERHAFPEPG